MSIVDISRRGVAIKIDLEQEPAFCGLGPSHAAIGINNQVAFYRLGQRDGKRVGQRQYMGSVQSIKLNETHAALLMEGRVLVHPIEVRGGGGGGPPDCEGADVRERSQEGRHCCFPA